MSRRGWLRLGAWAAALLLTILLAGKAEAACQREPVSWYNPTGWVGCTAYGEGWATRYPGPGVAVNSCVWPWDDCQPITITAHATGLSITVTPTMYCNCWHGTDRQVLVDLDPAAVRALGLNWEDGKYRVTVRPAGTQTQTLPDTATR